MTADPVVADNPEAQRYEIRIDDELVGLVTYRATGDRLVFTHAEIQPAFEGRGLGRQLATRALDDVRARGLMAVPRCPFIADFIAAHAEYQDLVPS